MKMQESKLLKRQYTDEFKFEAAWLAESVVPMKQHSG